MRIGAKVTNLTKNIVRLTTIVDSSKLWVRVPRIAGFNDENKIEESVKWVRDVIKVEPEVFDYAIPEKVNGRLWY